MFENNDYSDIIDRCYYPAMLGRGVAADISGWEFSPLAITPPLSEVLPSTSDLSRYYADSGNRLNYIKEQLVPALKILEGKTLHNENFTLLPSTTSGIGIVLAFLKQQKIKYLIIEGPAYFAVIEAAKRLGIACKLVAPVFCDNGRATTNTRCLLQHMDNPHVCVWIHQPHFSLGSDLSRNDIDKLIAKAQGKRYLVIDEANDNTVPSLMAGIHEIANVFRIRSLTKVLGLNGVRLALLLHPCGVRNQITEIMWSVEAALDWFSVSIAKSLTSPPFLYTDMIRQIRQRLLSQRELINAILVVKEIKLLPGKTGFLNCLQIDWRSIDGTESDKRKCLIKHLTHNRVPAMLGSHIYMPKLHGFEHIRINLFNSSETLRYGISVIHSFRSLLSLC